MKPRRCERCGVPVILKDGKVMDDRPEWRGFIHTESLCDVYSRGAAWGDEEEPVA